METKKTNFEDLKTTRKGKIGEDAIIDWLEKKGWVVYSPKTKSAHWFDNLVVKDKSYIRVVEVKTKAKMKFYDGTGIDTRHLREYQKFVNNHKDIEMWILFVDEELEQVYGNELIKLLKEVVGKDSRKYPLYVCGGKIVLFAMSNMKFFDIKGIDWDNIKMLNTRNYEYDTARHT